VRRADDPDAYVRKILINASNRRFRRRRSAEEARRLPEAPPADPAALADQRSDLMTALRGLPPRQRAVIVLRYWGDLSDAQVAALLGCSEGTVRSQAWRALAKLRLSAALRTAYLQAHLSNGATRRLAPAVVGGRKYAALAVAKGVKLARPTLYDTRRHVLADITSFPPVK
jgi:DNA-binding NarL/FixJ family response regulator